MRAMGLSLRALARRDFDDAGKGRPVGAGQALDVQVGAVGTALPHQGARFADEGGQGRRASEEGRVPVGAEGLEGDMDANAAGMGVLDDLRAGRAHEVDITRRRGVEVAALLDADTEDGDVGQRVVVQVVVGPGADRPVGQEAEDLARHAPREVAGGQRRQVRGSDRLGGERAGGDGDEQGEEHGGGAGAGGQGGLRAICVGGHLTADRGRVDGRIRRQTRDLRSGWPTRTCGLLTHGQTGVPCVGGETGRHDVGAAE